jgi:TRAP-type mannitol/chloroaromatic compound transport system permease large subunit
MKKESIGDVFDGVIFAGLMFLGAFIGYFMIPSVY